MEGNEELLMRVVHKTYNELIVCTKRRAGALGLVPRSNRFEFKLYDGKMQEAILREGSFVAMASLKSSDYVRAILKKVCPSSWYLKFRCDLIYCIRKEGYFECSCIPNKVTFKPAPPPKRSFFFILEALIALTKAWAGLDVDWWLVERYLDEAERLGDEDDLRALEMLREVVDPPGFEPGTSALRGRRSSS